MTCALRRSGTTAAALAATAVLLVGCGGQSEYCAAVEENAPTLESLGKERTTAAYVSYAEAFESVATVAPSDVQDDWTAMAEVTRGVLDAQESVGHGLEEMTDDEVLAALSQEQLASLNEAYEAFNGTADQRTAVVKNVKQECDITLQ